MATGSRNDHDVVGLEVAVNDAEAMGCSECVADLFGQDRDFFSVKRCFLIEALSEAFAVKVFHDKVRADAGFDIKIGDKDDVFVSDTCSGTGFSQESLGGFFA